ncbi:MAG TPA: alpha/beta hydrolase [Candidatus Dormibacteraeota bacterium]|nr:alpha/beta hydrolase [Candidatus Dormibacteraeota bacterium]
MPDRLVQIAIDTWSSRYVLRGVDHDDLARTLASVETWDRWHDAWRALGDRHAELARRAEVRGHRRTAGEAYVRASIAYHFARYLWHVEAEYEETGRLSVRAMQDALRLLDPTWERIEVPYRGGVLVGNLRRPPDVDRPPLVVLVPGLDSTKEEFFHWERCYLDRGMATLSLDGPGQGEGAGLPIEPEYERPLAAVLDHLAGRTDLDLDRVGAVGVSLGGYSVPRAMAFEPRLKAGEALAGVYDVAEVWPLWSPLTVRKFVKHTRTGSEEAARAFAARMTLEGVAERIRNPLLLVFGDRDTIATVEGQRRLARESGAELWLIEGGNHGVTNLSYLHLGPAADWMADRLRAAG